MLMHTPSFAFKTLKVQYYQLNVLKVSKVKEKLLLWLRHYCV